MFSKKEEFGSGAFNKYHAQVYLTVKITIQVPYHYQYTCDVTGVSLEGGYRRFTAAYSGRDIELLWT